jgi:threonine/homoserine/homoserine lactone efflux protein
MNEMFAVMTITILAVISPGPDFAMITRNSYTFGAKVGLYSSLGIACGVQIHVLYTILGISVVIISSPPLFLLMKMLGASYLIYLGYQSFTNHSPLELGKLPAHTPTPMGALRMGFLTNALNPKTMLFVVATYTQAVHPGSPISHNLLYGVFMSVSHWIWFSIVAIFFSTPAMRTRLLARQHIVDRCIGIVLIGLGASLGAVGLW